MKLGQAWVEILGDLKPFEDAIRRIPKMVSSIPVIGAGLGGAGVTAFLYKSITASADLAESVSKIGVMAGDSSDAVIAFADAMNQKFGTSKTEILDAAGIMTMLGREAKLSESAIVSFAEEVVTLSDDVASTFNDSFKDAFESIRSGLTGESEPLKKYGVFLNEAAVQTEALRMGLGGLSGALSDGDKVLARKSLIFQKLTVAMGDHERTAGSLSNQIKTLGGEWETFAQHIGASASAFATPLLSLANSFLSVANSVGEVRDDVVVIEAEAAKKASKLKAKAESDRVASLSAGELKIEKLQRDVASRMAAEDIKLAKETVDKEIEIEMEKARFLRDQKKRDYAFVNEQNRYQTEIPFAGMVTKYYTPEQGGITYRPGLADENAVRNRAFAGQLGGLGQGLLGMMGGGLGGAAALGGVAAKNLGMIIAESLHRSKDVAATMSANDIQKYTQEAVSSKKDETLATRENTQAIENLSKTMREVGGSLSTGGARAAIGLFSKFL